MGVEVEGAAVWGRERADADDVNGDCADAGTADTALGGDSVRCRFRACILPRRGGDAAISCADHPSSVPPYCAPSVESEEAEGDDEQGEA